MGEITYLFRGDQTLAIHEGKVIAASSDPDEVEALVKRAFGELPPGEVTPEQGMMPPPPEDLQDPNAAGEPCPFCGGQIDPATGACLDCGQPDAARGPRPDPVDPFQGGGPQEPVPSPEVPSGTYASVVTPNGLKGTLLGKVAGMWGDEVTVRLENGRIVRLPVGTELRTEKVAAAPRVSPIEHLQRRLAAVPDGTRESLVARSEELESIKKSASKLIRDGASWDDIQALNGIVVTADVEQGAVHDAVAHIDDADSYAPPGFSIQAAASTAGISREDASWLDDTYDQMIKQAEATDYQTLMNEGPEAFTAELPDVALADTGTTREMASDFIAERTAGVAREIVEPYTKTFLARVEECRRAELASRKQTTSKEAATKQDQYRDLPDDSLFL